MAQIELTKASEQVRKEIGKLIPRQEFLSTVIGELPTTDGAVEGSVGGYFPDAETFRNVKFESGAWTPIGEGVATSKMVDDKASLLQQDIDAFANGEGKTYTTLTEAMAVEPLPSDNTPFRIDADTPDDGNYIYLSSEPNGYKYLSPLIKKAVGDLDPSDDSVVPSSKDVADYGDANYTLNNLFRSASFYWEQGYYNLAGDPINSTDRIRVKDPVNIKAGAEFNIISNSNYELIFNFYDIEGSFLSTTGFIEEYPKKLTPPLTAVQYLLVLRKSDGSDITVASTLDRNFTIEYSSFSILDQIKSWVMSEAFEISDITYSDSGNVSSATLLWPDNESGTISHLVEDSDGRITSLRFNRPSNKFITYGISYDASGNVLTTTLTPTGY